MFCLNCICYLFMDMANEWDLLAEESGNDLAYKCQAVKDNFHGGSFNVISCKLLLSSPSLKKMENVLLPFSPFDYIDCMQKFNKVVHECFRKSLMPDYQESIEKFQKSFLALGISVAPKVHIAFAHIAQFAELKDNQGQEFTGLGVYSEQPFMALHGSFEKNQNEQNKYQISCLIAPSCLFL